MLINVGGSYLVDLLEEFGEKTPPHGNHNVLKTS
jgi:hypothetical protein